MAEGRQRDQWYHTAHLLSMLYNAFRSPTATALRPLDFHPLIKPPSASVTLRQLHDLGVLRPLR